MHGSKHTGQNSLFVDVSFSNGTLCACLSGPRVGDKEATLVANAVNSKLKKYGKRVQSLLLDMTAVDFISSLGLGMCIDVRNNADEVHAETTIVGLSCHLEELFDIMKLGTLFNIRSRQGDASKAA